MTEQTSQIEDAYAQEKLAQKRLTEQWPCLPGQRHTFAAGRAECLCGNLSRSSSRATGYNSIEVTTFFPTGEGEVYVYGDRLPEPKLKSYQEQRQEYLERIAPLGNATPIPEEAELPMGDARIEALK